MGGVVIANHWSRDRCGKFRGKGGYFKFARGTPGTRKCTRYFDPKDTGGTFCKWGVGYNNIGVG
eukprot:25744-Hanusia_phi.AAC.2